MANEQNLVYGNRQTPEQARENGRAGGIASGTAKRERKQMEAALRQLLDEEDLQGVTRRERLVKKVMQRLEKKGRVKDLLVLAEILGELKQGVSVSGGIVVVVEQPSTAGGNSMEELSV